jgi:hypothetical protein
MRIAALCLTFLFAASPATAASYMVGTWFGRGQPENKQSMYIDRMRADGSWRGEYRTCIKGKPPADWVQLGRWSLSGDVLSLSVETVNGVLAPRLDTYKMLGHDAHSQKYLSMDRNFPYTPQRVADNYQMPSCQLIS